jgi:hypothetical protein
MKEEDNDVWCDEESFREIENLTVFHLHTMKILKSVIEELAAFFVYENTSKNPRQFFQAPWPAWRPYMSGFGGPAHTCDLLMCSHAVPQAIPHTMSQE